MNGNNSVTITLPDNGMCAIVKKVDGRYEIDTGTIEGKNVFLGPKPDPITGLVACGCGREVIIAFYPGWHGVPDAYQIDCFRCHVGTRPCQTAEQAKSAWNRAIGLKHEAD